MKKTVCMLALMMASALVMAQKKPVMFMDIPVGGPADAMMQKLHERGFEYHAEQKGRTEIANTYMSGLYEGDAIRLNLVATPDSNVFRVWFVYNQDYNEKEVKQRFNALVTRYATDSTYFAPQDFLIPEEASVKMTMKKSGSIMAVFFQSDYETEQQIIDHELKALRETPAFQQLTPEEQQERSELMRLTLAEEFADVTANRAVWLKIVQVKNRYRIIMFFDTVENVPLDNDAPFLFI